MMEKQSGAARPGLRWKIVICILGLLLIIAGVSLALLKRSTEVVSETRGDSAPVAEAKGACCPAPSNGAALAAENDGELNWVKGLNARYTDEDYLFVILFGNTDADDMAYRAARSACEKIRQDGAIIDVAMPEISAAELSLTQERLGIQKLPAVLLFASTGQVDVIKGDINETRLLQSYLNMVKTCSPGSGCCGK